MAEYVHQPITGPQAFRETGTAAVESQAALLLLLGRQLRGDGQALAARAAAADMSAAIEAVPSDDLALFRLPQTCLRRRRGPQEPRSEEHTSELQSHHDLVCRLLLEKNKIN